MSETAKELLAGLLHSYDNGRSWDAADWNRVRAYLATGGWMPIESAPKDGTMVLLYGQMEGNTPFVGLYICAGWQDGDDGMEWIEATTGLEAFNAPHKPTHWHELPAPPKKGEV